MDKKSLIIIIAVVVVVAIIIYLLYKGIITPPSPTPVSSSPSPTPTTSPSPTTTPPSTLPSGTGTYTIENPCSQWLYFEMVLNQRPYAVAYTINAGQSMTLSIDWSNVSSAFFLNLAFQQIPIKISGNTITPSTCSPSTSGYSNYIIKNTCSQFLSFEMIFKQIPNAIAYPLNPGQSMTLLIDFNKVSSAFFLNSNYQKIPYNLSGTTITPSTCS